MLSREQFQEATELRRVRLFLELRPFDVRAATGIPESRLSAFETGRRPLSASERALLLSFLADRIAMVEAEVMATGNQRFQVSG
jgi:hypothetical protein